MPELRGFEGARRGRPRIVTVDRAAGQLVTTSERSRSADPAWLAAQARRDTLQMLTIFGACAVTFMMLMYALERRHPAFILAFAGGCALSSAYGFLAGTWPFGVVEIIWALVAVNRYRTLPAAAPPLRARSDAHRDHRATAT